MEAVNKVSAFQKLCAGVQDTQIKHTRGLWYDVSCDECSEGNLKTRKDLSGRGKRKAAFLDKVIMERHVSRDPTK